ncbi:MAG: cytochrome c biogenesis protein [Desulforhopalus sp.]|jgi:cytochrome c biogenesis protein
MLNRNNFLVKTFSSVELAIFIISAIAITSILGTVIPQNEVMNFYVERYGVQLAVIFQLLDITSMYSSFWFQGLLLLLCFNLAVCTYTRLPAVIAIIKKDNLGVSLTGTNLDPHGVTLCSEQCLNSSELNLVGKTLARYPHKTKSDEASGSHVYLHEKGAWSRTGAYVVHLSILFIIAGALIGKYFGYNASVMIPEGSGIAEVHTQATDQATIPLPFELFCQNFSIDYYQNGMVKEYRSDLTVLSKGEQILAKSITVNNPLKYKGITFYQSSYRAMANDYKVVITRTDTTKEAQTELKETLFIKPFAEQNSAGLGVKIKIVETSKDGHGHGPYKIMFDDEGNIPVSKIVNDNEIVSLDRKTSTFTISIGQRFATGLQVVKDPGVWIFYFGCGLMMLGLYIAFFMSHIRVWISVEQREGFSQISIVGKINKNNEHLERVKEKIVSSLLAEKSLKLRRV